MTATGTFIDSTDDAAIKTQLESLAVAGNLVIVINTPGNKVWLGKHV
jgi:hypothetical protein